jgi:hypothetical protein
MKTTRRLTAIIEREDGAYVSSCPELDIASQGDRLHGDLFVTQVELLVG